MFYQFAKCLVRFYLHIVYRIRITGISNVPPNGGLLVCANHRSNLDPVLVGCALPRELSFMAKKSLLEVPVLGALFRTLHAFPVNRGTADLSAVKTALKILRGGGVLNMYPEGTRSKDGMLHPFKPGACMIALKAGVPILPVCIRGGYHIFSKIEIECGKIIDPQKLVPDTSDASIAVVNDALYREIQTMFEGGRHGN